MYICLCQGVTDSTIEQAVSNGAKTLNDLRKQLKVSVECGQCAHAALTCLKTAQKNQLRHQKAA
jgi:bacterioferritin-associated ferredoxin